MRLKNTFTILLFCCTSLFCRPVHAQDSLAKPSRSFDRLSTAMGSGLDYGGMIGLQFLGYPHRHIGIFAAGGYLPLGYVYNVGVKVRFFNPERIKPKANFYLVAMYGYNAVIRSSNRESLSRLFYGLSFGLGLDTRYTAGKSPGYWSFGLNVPVPGPEVERYKEHLEDLRGVQVSTSLLPVRLSAGYHFVIY